MERNQAPSPFDTILMKGFFHSSRVQVESPEGSLVPKCGACGLFKSCQSPKMGRYGDGRKKVLVVGEAPGQTEDEDGRPFIGKAGTFLRQCLRQIGADLDQDAWTTNSLICRPPKNTTPEIKQISYCRPNLLNTIKRFGRQYEICFISGVVFFGGRHIRELVVHASWSRSAPICRRH